MSDSSQFVGNSLEELLVSLAEGVRAAQNALNEAPLLGPTGRPVSSYQLPYLDFTVQVDMQTRTDTGGRPVALMLMPRTLGTTSTEIHSTISGRFVATPPGDGLPVPRIGMSSGVNIGGVAKITLEVSNSAGERLADQRIELNIDDADSARLSAARGLTTYVRTAGTRLQDAVLSTDAQGRAATQLRIDDAQPGKSVLVVVASIGPFSSRVAVPMELLG